MHHIQKALGHSSVKVTEKYYAHYSPDSIQRQAMKVLPGGKR
jgi:integrase